jgi:hypothetical protein
MSAGAEPDDEAVARLLRSADASIEVPADLWERTRAVQPSRTRALHTPILAAAATAVLLLGGAFGGGLLLGRHLAPKPNPLARSAHPAMLIVYNAEAGCRSLRTIECSFGIKDRPSKKDGAIVGRVWHGDKVWATCVITDGDHVMDESGVSSNRWYRIVLPTTKAVGWLPGVRARNTVEIPECRGGS